MTDTQTLAHINNLVTLIEKLNEQDDYRGRQIEQLHEDVRALSNRVEALARVVTARETNSRMNSLMGL